MTEPTIGELERKAKEARRMADIAKHVPIPEDELEEYGDEASEKVCHGQIDLMKLACDLQNAYVRELSHQWEVIVKLRGEALYWKQKYEQSQSTK